MKWLRFLPLAFLDPYRRIRRRIAGENPSEIRGWLVDRYGAWVTYRPPAEPVTWPLWLAPILLLAGGASIARSRLKPR